MRNLVFKNLTSQDRRKKIISSCETMDKEGMRTVVRRRFICKMFEIKTKLKQKPLPQLYLYRVCNRAQQQESFSYRMKASLYLENQGRLFLVLFGHSLKIESRPAISVFI